MDTPKTKLNRDSLIRTHLIATKHFNSYKYSSWAHQYINHSHRALYNIKSIVNFPANVACLNVEALNIQNIKTVARDRNCIKFHSTDSYSLYLCNVYFVPKCWAFCFWFGYHKQSVQNASLHLLNFSSVPSYSLSFHPLLRFLDFSTPLSF